MLKHYLLIVCSLHCIFSNYFCSFPCGREHTVCYRERCILSYDCGRSGKTLRLGKGDKEWILHLHNTHRNRIALGEDSTGGNGKASNMHTLSYNRELEFVAQCWSDACRGGGKIHDSCRITKKFDRVGQNTYTSEPGDNKDFRGRHFLTAAVKSWYSGINLSDANIINSYKDAANSVRYFTQLMWAETTHVGCGRTAYSPKYQFYAVYIYCNYGIGGNIVSAPVYKRGAPCSECTNSTCNGNYAGLCGRMEDLSEDTWINPFGSSAPKLKMAFSKIVIVTILLVFI
ncbi:hypothetical protein ILUMI_18317 [Ignelater luminosus]|uniref:SCP domain-containing protein n=1 Tax=Ignelater luminosus TaxID=2038154 RepID=A0A8K0CLK0_IGNLU|nr:hypothetical protein ILUMI_18317 [Ignelater luminosus]